MTADDAHRGAERLLSGQPATPADVDALATVLAGFPIENLAAGTTLPAGSPGVVVLVDGALRAARPGAGSAPRIVGAMHAPGVAGEVALLASGGATSVAWVADEPCRLFRIPSADFNALLGETAAGAARFRWIVLAALTQKLARMSDFLRAVVSGSRAASDSPLDVAHAILEGCEPPRA